MIGAGDHGAWMERIRQSREDRAPHEKCWKAIHKEMAGRKYRDGWLPDEHGQPINLFNQFKRLLLPHLLPRDRRLAVSVVAQKDGAEYQRSAEALGGRVQAVLEQTRAVAELRRALEAELYSNGFLLIGMEVRTGIIDTVQPAEGGGQATIDVDRDRVGGREYLDADLPHMQHVPASRVYPDPAARSLDDAAFVCIETYRKIEAVKRDPMFARTADYLQPVGHAPPRELGDERSRPEDPLLKVTRLYYCYDRDARRVQVVSDSQGDPCILAELDWPKGIEGLPLVQLRYDEVEGHFWTNPVLAPCFDTVTMTDELFASIIQSVKSAKDIWAYDSNMLKADQVAPLATAPHLSLVGINGLTQYVQRFEIGGVNAEHWRVGELVKGLAGEIIGLGDLQRATSALSPGASATEVSALVSMSGIRLGDLRGAMLDGYKSAAAMVGGLLVANKEMLADIALPLADPRERRFVSFKDDLVGEGLDYGYEMEAAPLERSDPAVTQKRVQEMIGSSTDPALLTKLQTEGTEFRTTPLLKEYLRTLGRQDVDEIISAAGETAQAEQARAQEEDRIMLQTGAVLPVGPRDDHDAHLVVHGIDWQQSGAAEDSPILQHLAMHEQYLSGQQGGVPPEAGAAPGAPAAVSPAAGAGGMADEMGAATRAATAGT